MMLVNFDRIKYSTVISVDKWRRDISDINIFIYNLVNNGALIMQAKPTVVLHYSLGTLLSSFA